MNEDVPRMISISQDAIEAAVKKKRKNLNGAKRLIGITDQT
jgi:hypothetical protein